MRSLLSDSFGRVARAVFAAGDLKNADEATRKLAKTAANRVVLGGVHTGLSTTLRKWTEEPELLAGHVINADAAQYLVQVDVKRFLNKRAVALRGRVDRFLHDNAGFDQPVVRAPAFYLEPDDMPDDSEAK